MTSPPADPRQPAGRRFPRGLRAWVGAAGVVLAVAGALILAGALSAAPTAAPSPGPPAPAAEPAPTARPSRPVASPSVGRRAATPTPARSRLIESAPVRVTIPELGVDAPTVKLGIGAKGELETPADPDDVGWFVGAHTPGGPGTAVVAGHVTWNGRPTVFSRLDRLDAGATVSVARRDGTTAHFEVTRRSTFPKREFPTDEVYGASAEPQLILITCGGDYDVERRFYDANVIVWARLRSVSG